MKSTQDIVDSIDTRLRELSDEINTLNAARSALDASERQPSTQPPRRTSTRSIRATGDNPAAPSNNDAARTTSQESTTRPPKRTSKAARRTTTRASRTTSADHLESLLSGNGDLTTAELAERASANRNQVLNLLRDLERAGRVRRTGQRRSTRWHAITDEDRLHQRIAELEASRRRPASR